MDAVIARIKEYVTTLYPTILEDLVIDAEYLDFMVADVVDRVLIYTNRDQLVPQFEDAIEDYGDPKAETQTQNEKDFWEVYRDYPIPIRLERTVAKIVAQSCRTVKTQNTAEDGTIKSVSDNGQSVTYSDKLQHFFSSSDDADVFAGSLELLKRFRLPTVIRGNNERTKEF